MALWQREDTGAVIGVVRVPLPVRIWWGTGAVIFLVFLTIAGVAVATGTPTEGDSFWLVSAPFPAAIYLMFRVATCRLVVERDRLRVHNNFWSWTIDRPAFERAQIERRQLDLGMYVLKLAVYTSSGRRVTVDAAMGGSVTGDQRTRRGLALIEQWAQAPSAVSPSQAAPARPVPARPSPVRDTSGGVRAQVVRRRWRSCLVILAIDVAVICTVWGALLRGGGGDGAMKWLPIVVLASSAVQLLRTLTARVVLLENGIVLSNGTRTVRLARAEIERIVVVDRGPPVLGYREVAVHATDGRHIVVDAARGCRLLDRELPDQAFAAIEAWRLEPASAS